MTDWHLQNRAAWKRLVRPRLPSRPAVFIEIGSHEGSSALCLVEEVLRESDRLICVDPWADRDAEATFIAATSGERRVTRHKGRSADYMVQIMAASPDFRADCIYIDGDHDSSSVLADAVLSWRMLSVGGMLVFDDYRWNHEPSVVGQQPPMFRQGFSCPVLLDFIDKSVSCTGLSPTTAALSRAFHYTQINLRASPRSLATT